MKNHFFKIVLFFSILSIFISCKEEDPITPQEEHFEAIGMVFYDSGIEVARILRGVTSDTLVAPEGGLSGHLDIKFINEDEKIIAPPDDEDKKLAWVIDDNTIADIFQHEGEEGSFEFHLEGLKIGNTKIEFFVNHEDHMDYRSGKIPVRIEKATEQTHGKPIGFKLYDEESGRVLLTVNNTTVSNELDISVNSTTEHIEIKFFDANNVEFQPDVPPHALVVEIANTNIAEVTGQEENEPWAFKFHGKSVGSTTVTIKILHDGEVGKQFSPFTLNVK